MNVLQTAISGLLIVEPKLFGDSRGFFTEIYHADRYGTAGIPARFVQDNLSRSARDACAACTSRIPGRKANW